MNEDIYEYIFSLPMWATEKNSTEDIAYFLERMGTRPRGDRVVHVAGTNGKGSVCAYLTQILLDRGLHAVTFTSPHLVDIRERIRVDGTPAEDALFRESAERVRAFSGEMQAEGHHAPQYFEFLFLTAMDVCRRLDPDYIVLETGLGGRLDATNTVPDPRMAVITSVSMDHMQYLGDTVEAIAAEKAGIIKPGRPVVFLDKDPRVSAVIRARAAQLEAPQYPVRPPEGTDAETLSFLPADYMKENAAVALRCAALLGFGEAEGASLDSVRKAVWPGRMDEVEPDVWIDGAHNEDGIRAFADAARAVCLRKGARPVLLLSAVRDKDLEHMFGRLLSVLSPVRIYLCTLDSKRRTDAGALRELLLRKDPSLDIRVFGPASEAYEAARRELERGEILFCAGSLYLAGELLKLKRGTHDQV